MMRLTKAKSLTTVSPLSLITAWSQSFDHNYIFHFSHSAVYWYIHAGGENPSKEPLSQFLRLSHLVPLDNLQHHKPNGTTRDTQFMHSKQSFINLLKFLQEFALQIRMTWQHPPTQSKLCNAPSSTIAEDAHSGTLSTHWCRRPEIGSHKFS